MKHHLPKYILSLSFILYTLYLILHTFLIPVSAQSLTVSFTVKNTYFVVNGFTSPGAFVAVSENNAVVGSTQAASDGSFTITILTDPGIHDFGIYATDTDGHTTATVTETVSLTANTTTTMNNVILPATVSTTSPTTLSVGTPIELSGQAVPDSTILIIVDNTPLSPSVTVSSTGSWSASIDTSTLSSGSHTIGVKNTVTGGYESEVSLTIMFTIESVSTSSVVPGSSTSPIESSSPTSNSSPSQVLHVPGSSTLTCSLPSWARLFDSNHNCILDFRESINALDKWVLELQDYYLGNGEIPEDKRGKCDFNADKACNIIDLSVLLYYVDR